MPGFLAGIGVTEAEKSVSDTSEIPMIDAQTLATATQHVEAIKDNPWLAPMMQRFLTYYGDTMPGDSRPYPGLDAALDRLTDAEREEFTRLNDAYKSRFGFPFILAVKGRRKTEIRDAFLARLENDAAAEFAEALRQIERIALLRLKDLLA